MIRCQLSSLLSYADVQPVYALNQRIITDKEMTLSLQHWNDFGYSLLQIWIKLLHICYHHILLHNRVHPKRTVSLTFFVCFFEELLSSSIKTNSRQLRISINTVPSDSAPPTSLRKTFITFDRKHQTLKFLLENVPQTQPAKPIVVPTKLKSN